MTDARDRARGALLGLAIGDALGAPYEFMTRDTFHCDGMIDSDKVSGAPFPFLKAGQWTDDTSMALCLADSLLAHPNFHAYDCMKRFQLWRDTGYNSSTGKFFDIGFGTNLAIDKFANASATEQLTRVNWDEHDSAGNGCIMRIAPVAIMHHRNWPSIGPCTEIAMKQCQLTHGAPIADAMSQYIVYLLGTAINGDAPLRRKIRNLDRSEIKSDGYVADTVEAAYWCLAHTDNFRDAVLTAVNLGGDSDTTGAVTGQLAGAVYGESGIPDEWRTRLYDGHSIQTLADQLFNQFEP